MLEFSPSPTSNSRSWDPQLHPQRSYFQIRPHSQVPGVGLRHVFLRGGTQRWAVDLAMLRFMGNPVCPAACEQATFTSSATCPSCFWGLSFLSQGLIGVILLPLPFFFFFFFLSPHLQHIQARGLIRATAVNPPHSHSNVGSEPRLQPTLQLTAMPEP